MSDRDRGNGTPGPHEPEAEAMGLPTPVPAVPEATSPTTPVPAAPERDTPTAPAPGPPAPEGEAPTVPAVAPSAPEREATSPPVPPRAALATPPRRTIEPPEPVREVSRRWLAAQSRRSFLVFGAGVLAAATGAWFVLPDRARRRWLPGPVHHALDTLGARIGLTRGRRERFLNRALTFDDDVAEALYSPHRRVRTYQRSQVTTLRNNYNGRTPGPGILNGWTLVVDGLAAGTPLRLERAQLLSRFPLHGQVTRLVCVEGWSAIAWWGGIRFADFLAAFPPAPGARWAAIRSDVNLDGRGRPDPYYVSIDMDTLRHPQTLLATHHDGRTLTLAHGAPLRLLVPVKLGLKNIKAITHITYAASEPPDYWHERGYSKYDGI